MNKLKCFIAAIACLASPSVGSAVQVMPTPGFNLGNTLESTWGYTPPTKALIVAQAIQIVGDTPAEFAAFIKQDIAQWKAVATQANVSVSQ